MNLSLTTGLEKMLTIDNIWGYHTPWTAELAGQQ
jgi:hypothetical protein